MYISFNTFIFYLLFLVMYNFNNSKGKGFVTLKHSNGTRFEMGSELPFLKIVFSSRDFISIYLTKF
jgi:hypothetical protein